MARHSLKTWPAHFIALRAGVKRCELRRGDRAYAVGDELELQEWMPHLERYTGRCVRARVTHIATGGPWLADGYVAMSLEFLPDREERRTWLPGTR